MDDLFKLDFGTTLATSFMGERTPADEIAASFGKFASSVLKSETTGKPVLLQKFQDVVITALKVQETGPKGRVTLIILPRGFGKSSLITTGYPSWLTGGDKNLRTIVASNTKDQATTHLRGIESVLEDPDYQAVFGDLVPHKKEIKWTEDVKYVWGRTRAMRDATFRSSGVGSAEVTGKRSDLIVVDDLIDLQHANSPTEREHAWQWFEGSLAYTLDPSVLGRIIVVNTRYHFDDLAGRLKKKYGDAPDPHEFLVVDIPALVADETGELRSIWEDRFPTKELIRERELAYFSFQSHFMNDPVDFSKSAFPEAYLNFVDENTVDLEAPYMEYYAGVDPNTAREDIKKDYFAMVIVGVDHRKKKIYVVDMLYTRANMKELRGQFQAMINKWHPTKIMLEANAAQVLYETVFNEDAQYLNLPFERVFATLKKEERILQMSNHFFGGRVQALARIVNETGKMEIIPVLEPLRREWITFPHSETHFDTLDALDLALRPLLGYIGEAVVSVISPAEFNRRIVYEQVSRLQLAESDILNRHFERVIRDASLSTKDRAEIDEEEPLSYEDRLKLLALLEQARLASFKPRQGFFGTIGRKL